MRRNVKQAVGRAGGKAPGLKAALAPIRTALAPLPGIDGALGGIDGVSGAQAGFQSGSDGHTPTLAWARYHGTGNSGKFLAGYGPWWGQPGSEISYERSVVAATALDLLTSNTAVATLVENLSTQAIGEGLTLSSKPNAARCRTRSKPSGARGPRIQLSATRLKGTRSTN
jgi:hypothetical protein